MDAIFDDALFGAPAPEVSTPEAASPGEASVRVGSVEWYMGRDAQPAGPFRLERLRELWHHGELSPDTLFWCEGWSTWRPLSRVPELVAALTSAGLPTVAADSIPAASARAKEVAPEEKVVSALPSLVAQEEAWMEKMREEQEQAKEEARAALLNAPSAPVPTPIPVPVPVPVPVQFVPVPVPVAPPVVAPPVIPSLADTEAPVPARRGKGLLVGAVLGGAAVALVAGALVLLPRIQLAPVQEAPRQEAPTTASVTPPPRPPVQAPVPEAPKPAPPVVAAAPVVQPVAPAPPAPAPVVTPPAEKKQEPQVVTAVARAEPPRTAAVKEAEASGRRLATARPEQPRAVEEERLARAAESAIQRRSPPPVAAPAPVAPAKVTGRKALADDSSAADPTNFDDSLDKEFEKELGFAKDSPKHKPEDPRSKRTVYLPPEPGADLPESISTSDVMQVVSSHKDGIVSCIQEHAPPAPESGKGRFVVRWRIQTSGTASDVLMETEELKGTPFARCIMDQVRSWKFPKHRVQSREPVRFPFTY